MSDENLTIAGFTMDNLMKKVLKDAEWIAVTTNKCDGFHTIGVWDAVILDNGTLGLFAGGMFQTKKNLEENAYIELMAAAKKDNQGYRFKGNAKMVPKKEVESKIAEKMKLASKQFYDISHSIVVIELTSATKLI